VLGVAPGTLRVKPEPQTPLKSHPVKPNQTESNQKSCAIGDGHTPPEVPATGVSEPDPVTPGNSTFFRSMITKHFCLLPSAFVPTPLATQVHRNWISAFSLHDPQRKNAADAQRAPIWAAMQLDAKICTPNDPGVGSQNEPILKPKTSCQFHPPSAPLPGKGWCPNFPKKNQTISKKG
jgi:hypothetical protein